MEKSIRLLAAFCALVCLFRCSNGTLVIPEKDKIVATEGNNAFVKPRNNTGARTYYPGIMTHTTGTTYVADFEGGGVLTFTGPNPLPTPPTIPVFYSVSTNIPYGSLADTGVNTFVESFTYASDVVVDTPEGEVHILGPGGSITLNGKIITMPDGNWHAVVDTYQLGTGPVNPCTPPAPVGGTSTITPFVGGASSSSFSVKSYYSFDNEIWFLMDDVYSVDSDMSVYVETFVTNTTGSSVGPVTVQLKLVNSVWSLTNVTFAVGETKRISSTSVLASSNMLWKTLIN